MHKYYLFIALLLVTLMFTAIGCGSDSAEPTPEPEVTDEPAAEVEDPAAEEPVAEEPVEEEATGGDLLSGLANNKSAEICTAYKAYDAFIGIQLGLNQDDIIAGLNTLGMIEVNPMEDTTSGTQKTRYAYEDEQKEAYFDIEFFEGVLVKKMYHIPFSLKLETGFAPTKGIYDALHELMKAGTVNNLADVEAIFGPAYLFAEAYSDNANPEAGLNVTYRWRGGTHNIDIYTDETDTLKGFKIGASALPE
ncbi:MAG: hypothetical protein U1E11_07530 [Dethiobacteria bacterium]|nr:hypothetical protein [Dethiobacteria bacterium]